MIPRIALMEQGPVLLLVIVWLGREWTYPVQWPAPSHMGPGRASW